MIAVFVFFALTALTAIFLLLTALVVWLSEVMGSFVGAALLVGGFFGILATVTYLLSIREAVERIRIQLETVYEVAQAAKAGYEWITKRLFLLLSLLGK